MFGRRSFFSPSPFPSLDDDGRPSPPYLPHRRWRKPGLFPCCRMKGSNQQSSFKPGREVWPLVVMVLPPPPFSPGDSLIWIAHVNPLSLGGKQPAHVEGLHFPSPSPSLWEYRDRHLFFFGLSSARALGAANVPPPFPPSFFGETRIGGFPALFPLLSSLWTRARRGGRPLPPPFFLSRRKTHKKTILPVVFLLDVKKRAIFPSIFPFSIR